MGDKQKTGTHCMRVVSLSMAAQFVTRAGMTMIPELSVGGFFIKYLAKECFFCRELGYSIGFSRPGSRFSYVQDGTNFSLSQVM